MRSHISGERSQKNGNPASVSDSGSPFWHAFDRGGAHI